MGIEWSFAPNEVRKSPPRILADDSKAGGRLRLKGEAPIPITRSKNLCQMTDKKY